MQARESRCSFVGYLVGTGPFFSVAAYELQWMVSAFRGKFCMIAIGQAVKRFWPFIVENYLMRVVLSISKASKLTKCIGSIV